MEKNNCHGVSSLQKELHFKLNAPLSSYIEALEPHEVQPNSFFETKYNLYKSNVDGLNSLFNRPFCKETILLFYRELLCAVYYKFKGNQLDYFHDLFLQYMPENQIQNISSSNRNSIIYEFTEVFLIEVLFTENNTTGICVMNSLYREDQLKSIQEKDYELMLIKNDITL